MATILVVEDERELNSLIYRHLEAEGHRVVQAFDGSTALEVARQERPDLVVLDWMLPTLDGMESLAKEAASRSRCRSRLRRVDRRTERSLNGDTLAKIR